MSAPERTYLTRREASEYLRQLGFPTATATLAKYAVLGNGPLMVRFGRRPLYRPNDLLEWAESRSRVVRSTSEARAPAPSSESAR